MFNKLVPLLDFRLSDSVLLFRSKMLRWRLIIHGGGDILSFDMDVKCALTSD